MSEHETRLRASWQTYREDPGAVTMEVALAWERDLDGLLAEHRAEVEALQEELKRANQSWAAARDAALEEAAQRAASWGHLRDEHGGASDRVAERIRALKSQPARQYVDAEKVREVLLGLRESALIAGHSGIGPVRASGRLDVVVLAAERIGVDLDADGDATPNTPQVVAAARNAAGLPPLETRQTCTCAGQGICAWCDEQVWS